MSTSEDWKRNTDSDYPRVWVKFMAKDLNSDDLVEYRVEDLTEDRFDDAVDHMLTYFVKDEPICKSKRLIDDEKSVAGMRKLYRGAIQYKVGLVCYKENSNDIIGMNVTVMSFLKEKKDNPEIEGIPLLKLYQCMDYVTKQYDVFGEHGVDKYLSAYGLSVRPEYRGRNIGYHILKARIPLCKEIGVKVTSTVFTAIASQTLARKAGYEVKYEITYDQLGELGWKFDDINEKNIKVMTLRIE